MNFFTCIFFNALFCYQCAPSVAMHGERSNSQMNLTHGQCPYLFSSPQSCVSNCTSDDTCGGSEKCCSNGCGENCAKPLFLTGCQHQREVAKYHLDHSVVSSSFVPHCKPDGSFEPRQCDNDQNECWCVDFRGFEISQSRTPSHTLLDCSTISYSGNCPLYNCVKDCEHGFAINKNGCRTCECIDPCSKIQCRETKTSCKFFTVKCTVEWPCPPVPLCLLKPI